MIGLLVKYVLTAAVKDRLFIGLILISAVAISLSLFLGSSAVTEKDQFTLVFASGGLRIAGLLAIILFTVFYIRRSFETRDVEYLLARPVSRLQYLISHFLALSVLALIVSCLISFVLLVIPTSLSTMNVLIWGFSLWIEYTIVVCVSLFFALMLSSAVSASLMSLAFYVLGRLIGSILAIIEAGEAGGPLTLILEKIMLLISVFIPRIDLLGQTSWLVYGYAGTPDLFFIASQGAIFCGFIFAISFWDLRRKQF